MVPTFSRDVSCRSSSGTRSMPRCSILSFPANLCALAYMLLPYSKLSPGTAPPSSTNAGRLWYERLPTPASAGFFSTSNSSYPIVASHEAAQPVMFSSRALGTVGVIEGQRLPASGPSAGAGVPTRAVLKGMKRRYKHARCIAGCRGRPLCRRAFFAGFTISLTLLGRRRATIQGCRNNRRWRGAALQIGGKRDPWVRER